MEATITVALIIAVGGIVTQLLIAAVSKKATTEIINYRVGQLETKVMKHNNLVERMTVVEESIKSAHHRIDRFEKIKE